MAFTKPSKDYETKMRIRMSSKDVFYGGGVVNGSRSIRLMGDVAERLMIMTEGNEGKCIEYEMIRLYNPIFAGDYLEMVGRIIGEDGSKKKIQCRTFKIATNPNIENQPSAIDVLEEPVLCTEFIGTYDSVQ
ncbi:3-aminobutyryl-CoA ammonia lyase [Clostridium tetani]|uniref:3-aminobutyryl-CoA ammonia lyase n=1 Tax=Clostridium tetani TaxID=1513 RepID=A0ABC8EF87_CLOTA|nr:hotdog fold domain-containing protein [Clostridium tetani]BDR67867.1 3-aminobutyryl-CoA ammonia lyase [Clostridium tetani]BDR81802.1 3-aminobutyryl-CoA ammonia lyase [Clostridium tetani]BDR90184.1 3-aminobutyryl-CoA ammonia lyase [Clostridium tetani]